MHSQPERCFIRLGSAKAEGIGEILGRRSKFPLDDGNRLPKIASKEFRFIAIRKHSFPILARLVHVVGVGAHGNQPGRHHLSDLWPRAHFHAVKIAGSDLTGYHKQREGNSLLLQDGIDVSILRAIGVVECHEDTVGRRRRSFLEDVFEILRLDECGAVRLQRLNLLSEFFFVDREVIRPCKNCCDEGLGDNAMVREYETTCSGEIIGGGS